MIHFSPKFSPISIHAVSCTLWFLNHSFFANKHTHTHTQARLQQYRSISWENLRKSKVWWSCELLPRRVHLALWLAVRWTASLENWQEETDKDPSYFLLYFSQACLFSNREGRGKEMLFEHTESYWPLCVSEIYQEDFHSTFPYLFSCT